MSCVSWLVDYQWSGQSSANISEFFKDYFAKATAVIINVHFSITCLLLSYSSHPTTLRIITVTHVGPVCVSEAAWQSVYATCLLRTCVCLCVCLEGKPKTDHGYFFILPIPMLVYKTSTWAYSWKSIQTWDTSFSDTTQVSSNHTQPYRKSRFA